MFTDPVKNLRQFGIGEDMIVVDLGAGTGFYSVALTKMVPKGKVYAIEIIKDFLATIKNKAKDLHLNNIECLWGNVEKIGGTNLGDDVADAVVASNIISHLENKERFINEIKRILKPGGKVLIVDWSTHLSKADSLLKKIISKEEVKKMFEELNFTSEREIDAGESHYGIIFKKQ